MALIIKDRVKEITTTTGTGAVSLGGASATFDAFQSVMSNGDTTFYAIVHTASGTDEWEVGLGTWNTGNTLTRTTVYAGSNGTSAVNFSSGNKDIFMTYPASKAVVAGEDVTFADITATDITSTGTVTLSADPSSSLQAATKQYVDTIAAAGIHYHTPVRVEHPSNLNATYNNGSSGVGATLTNAGTNAALVLDNVSMVLNDRVLVANQTDQTQNGVYTVTTVGDGSTAWVLTRSTDTDTAGPSDPDAFGKGDAFFIKEGDTNAGHLDVLTTTGTIVFGTTNIVFSEVAETSIYSAGTGLTLTGTTFSTNQDISTSASPTFAGGTFTGNVDLGDDDYIRLGDSQDLQIYHNASHSVIKDAGTGNLNLLADNFRIANAGWSKWYFIANNGGAATVFWNGQARLATSSGGIDVTGNITVSGSVDGRDVATDGTKLDGIETGATGDQTASEILTAIKTVDGAASGLDADLLDGQQGSYYLNTSTTFSGDVSGTYNNIVVANDSHTHDGRYYTETEADSRFVNVTGDTMTAPLTIDTNTNGMLRLSATNSSPWAIDLQRDDVTNSRVYNGGGYWTFEHEPRFFNNGSPQKLFHDGYHPNADKWTTARTLSLSGDASGSVSWDGSANATLSVTVANDSHSHSNYITSNANDSFSGLVTSTNTTVGMSFNGALSWAVSSSDAAHQRADARDDATNYSRLHWYGVSDGGSTNYFRHAWYDGSAYINIDANASNINFTRTTGTANLQVHGNTVWHAGNDGSGSGLDADLLDGVHGSSFLRSDADDTTSGHLTVTEGIITEYIDVATQGNRTIQALATRNTIGSSGGYGDLHLNHYGGNVYMAGDDFSFTTSGVGTTNGSWRAPIFYDSNNTGYYVDPASTSNMSRVQAADWYYAGGNSGLYFSSWGGGFHMTDSTWVRVYNGKSFYQASGTLRCDGDIRAPIFYDQNNTSYYSNQASTSVFNQINVTTLNTTSDIRFKSDLVKIDNAVDKVKAINGYTYMLDGNDDRKGGLIAQEVEEVLPEAVKGDDYKKLLDYNATRALLVEAIKEQQYQIDALKKQLNG